MSENRKVQITQPLFNNILALVEYIKIKDYELPRLLKLDEIYIGLRDKQHSINKRAVYSDIIYSSGNKRKEAQLNYLKLKNKK